MLYKYWRPSERSPKGVRCGMFSRASGCCNESQLFGPKKLLCVLLVDRFSLVNQYNQPALIAFFSLQLIAKILSICIIHILKRLYGIFVCSHNQ